MSNGLGKANYETNADEFIAAYAMKNEEESKSEAKKNNDEVYVIDIDEYKSHTDMNSEFGEKQKENNDEVYVINTDEYK